TRSHSWVRATVAASCLGWLFCLGFVLGVGWLLDRSLAVIGPPLGPFGRCISGAGGEQTFQSGLIMTCGSRSSWNIILGLSPKAPSALLWSFAAIAACSIMLSILVVWLAAASVARVWQDKPLPRSVLWLQQTFCQPLLLKRLLSQWQERQLRRNPVGWLQ